MKFLITSRHLLTVISFSFPNFILGIDDVIGYLVLESLSSFVLTLSWSRARPSRTTSTMVWWVLVVGYGGYFVCGFMVSGVSYLVPFFYCSLKES